MHSFNSFLNFRPLFSVAFFFLLAASPLSASLTMTCFDQEHCTEANSCSKNAEAALTIYSDCSAIPSVIVLIDMDGNGTLDAIGNSDPDMPPDNPNNLPVVLITVEPAAEPEKYYVNLEAIELPIGETVFHWSATDICGALESCDSKINVSDCQAPIIQGYNGFDIQLSYNGTNCELELSAEIFVENIYDNCSENFEYLLVFPSQGEGQIEPPEGFSDKHILDEYSTGTNIFDLWAIDESGRASYLTLYIIVTANTIQCNPIFLFSEIYVDDINGNKIEEVELGLMNPSGLPDPYSPDYYYTVIPEFPFEMCPEKTVNPRNGVSTLDLVLLARRIVGFDEFDSHLQRMAADANGDKQISMFDVITIQKVILFVDDNFANDESWKITLQSYEFPEQLTSLNISDYPTCATEVDIVPPNQIFFSGVKTGDMNFSADPENSIAADDREEISAILKNEVLMKGMTYSIPLRLDKSMHSTGFQMAMNLDTDKIELVNIEVPENFTGQYLWDEESRLITLSYFNMEGHPVTAGAELFNINVRAKSNTPLTTCITLANDKLQSEIYNDQFDVYSLNLEIEPEHIDDDDLVNFVYSFPNPIGEEGTTISIQLASAQAVNLVLYDVHGKRLLFEEKKLEKGKNEIALSADLFTSPGLYFLKLETAAGVLMSERLIRP